MPRGKKKKTSHSRKGKRMGGMKLTAENPIVKFGSIAAGYFFADKINAGIDKLTGDKIDGKIVAGVQTAGGAYLVFKKGKKNIIVTAAAGVLAGAGIKRAMSEFGLAGLHGYQSVPAVAGYQSIPAVAGTGVKRIGYDHGLNASAALGVYARSSRHRA